jgi:hypothetical protein
MKLSNVSKRAGALAFIALAACGSQAADLAAHWRMDEASGSSTLAPAVGTNTVLLKNGMASGVPAVDATGVSAPYGSAAQIVDSKELIPATGDFGVFLWVAFTNEPGRVGQKHLFSCNAGQANRCAFAVDMAATPGTLGWWHDGGPSRSGVAVINDGAWHHVGFTRVGGAIQLWVDGVRDGSPSATSSAPISQAQDWRLAAGVSEAVTWSFAGRMDDLRVYAGALTDEEVAALAASAVPAQAVHRWRLNEAAGARVFAPDAGWMAAATLTTPEAGVKAVDAAGVRLNGASGLRIPGSKFLIPATNDFSVFLWARDESAAMATAQLFSNNALGSSQTNRCSFGLNINTTTAAGKLFFFHPDSTLTGNAVIRDLGWHHVGLVRRGNRMELWVDGDLDASHDYAEGFTLSQAFDWRVGSAASETTDFFAGRIDDLRLCTNALAVAEVAALYGSYTPTNSLVAHWTFNDAANVRFLQPETGWREILATNVLQSGATGVDGTGLWANSTSRGRILGSKKLIPATNDFTVLLWIRTTNTTDPEKHLFANSAGQEGRSHLTMDATPGKVTWWVRTAYGLVSVSAGTGPVVDDGAWHQVGISRNGKTFRLWVDGVNVNNATSIQANPSVTQSNDWFIAANASAAYYGAVGTGYALMDDLRIYNYGLDATAVTALYNAFKPFPTDVPTAPLTDFSAIEAETGGKVVGHLPKISEESGFHLPSLAVLQNGTYLGSATVLNSPLGVHTKVYRSTDRGASWSKVSEVAPLYGGVLFESGGALHLLGNNSDGGTVVIRRSSDSGTTWTSPTLPTSGILTTNTGWNFRAGAPTVRDGRIWLYAERRGNTARGTYAANVEAGALSAPAGADLLNAANWTVTWPLTTIPESWDTAVNFRGWTDGRTVADKEGALRMLMRVNRFSDHAEYAALLTAGQPDAALTHAPFADMALLPGGASAFSVRYDPVSSRFWAMTNPDSTARVGLFSSFTLRDWAFHAMPLEAQAGRVQAFMWPDFQIDGGDLISICRAAYADQDGEPASAGDLNYVVFKRIPNFRQLQRDKAEARLLAADTGNGCVRRYSFGTQYGWLFDDGADALFAKGAYAGQPLSAPYGLAEAGGTVYVSENVAAGRVLAFSKRGAFRGVVCTFGAGSVPGALAAGAGGALFVSDAATAQVWRVDAVSGQASVWLAMTGSGYALNDPQGLACDGGGNLYVANRGAGQILKVNAAGELVATFALAAADALAWDAEAGRLLASAYATPDLVSLHPSTGAATTLLDNGAGSQRFRGVAKLNGSLLFTSDANNRISRQTGAASYVAADIRLSAPGQLLVLPQGADVFPEAKLGTQMLIR